LLAMRKPYYINSEEFHCSATVGVSLFRGISHPIESVINQADKAMYKAKLSGKNSICVYSKKSADKPRVTTTTITGISLVAQG